MEGKVTRWTCPKLCGYYRPWHDSPAYYDRIVEHPLYGWVNGRQLVEQDIASHDCEQYLAALERLRKRP